MQICVHHVCTAEILHSLIRSLWVCLQDCGWSVQLLLFFFPFKIDKASRCVMKTTLHKETQQLNQHYLLSLYTLCIFTYLQTRGRFGHHGFIRRKILWDANDYVHCFDISSSDQQHWSISRWAALSYLQPYAEVMHMQTLVCFQWNKIYEFKVKLNLKLERTLKNKFFVAQSHVMVLVPHSVLKKPDTGMTHRQINVSGQKYPS